jgi:hypothetical protein
MSAFIIPSSALAKCPHMILSAAHWSHYAEDGKCNCDRICSYKDADGGPCKLLVDDHPRDRAGRLVHDDGDRWQAGAWKR